LKVNKDELENHKNEGSNIITTKNSIRSKLTLKKNCVKKTNTIKCESSCSDASSFIGTVNNVDKNLGNSKQLSLLYFNARSIRNKMDELNILIQEHKPDVIAVVESWLNEDISDSELSLENYNFIRVDRHNDQKSKGGGIIIYVNLNLSFINVTTTVCNNIDHIWIKLHDKNVKAITLGIFYRPPDSNEEEINFLIKQMSKFQTVRTLLIGDFNFGDINWRNQTSGSKGKLFLKAVKNLALFQCVKEKTRGTNILDLVLVYDKNFLYNLESLPPIGKSDHNTLKITLNSIVNPQNNITRSFNYNKANYKILEEIINQIDWECEIKTRSVEDYWKFLMAKLDDFKEMHIPKCNRKNSNDLPWFNNYLRKLIKKRNNLFKRYKKSGKFYFKIKYISARNLVTKQIRIAKIKYESKIIKRSKNNRKIFYSYVQNKNRKTLGRKIGPLIDAKRGDEIVDDDTEMAKILNDQFCSVFSSEELVDQDFNISSISNQGNVFDTINITNDEVLKAIGEFKANKSPGIDNTSSTYALKIKEIVAKPLQLLFNKSIATKEIPSEWKMANVTPIFKKGNKSAAENYRPVSLTVFFCKVLEKIVKKYMENFLESIKYIYTSQHGFTKGRSCMTNLLICHNSIVSMLNDGSSIDIIYLDFQKAFDKVPHGRLMWKVRKAGIGGKLAEWIENWLTGRKQRVVINGLKSEWAEVKSGVPQGSILGPLLFSIYINDLEENVSNNMLKFADDSKLWGRVNSPEEVTSMQEDLIKLGEWSDKNSMPFNVSKCKVMHVGRKNSREKYKLKGQQILETKEEKDLGVVFNESFKPSINCNKVSKSANKVIGLIKRTISNKTAEGMLILYKTLVRPIVDYCISVWRPFTKKDKEKLEKVQRRYTKMIIGCRGKTYEQRLDKLRLTTLDQRHYRADMVQVFKILKDQKNIYPTDFLTLSKRSGRINCMKLYKKRSCLDVSKHCFTSRVVDQWNILPDRVILATDVNDFKSRLDHHMRGVRGRNKLTA